MQKRKKWLYIALGFILALILGSSLNSKPINNRAVVVGMAIDTADSGGIEITAQILITEAGADKTLSGKEISAIGDTVAGAFSEISISTSMDVSLAHCNLIILGGGILKTNAFYPLDYLMRNSYLSENAMLVGTTDKAKDILSAKTAFSQLTSFYAQRALETQDDYLDVAQRTIKSFAVDQKSHLEGNYLTLIEKLPLETPSIETSSGEEGQNSTEKEPEYYFNMEKTAVFLGSKMVGILSGKETVGLNAVRKKVSQGSIELVGDGGRVIDLYVVDFKSDASIRDRKPVLEIKTSLTAILKEINVPDGYIGSLELELSPKELEQANRYIEDAINECFSKCKALGVDIYDISGKMYRKYGIDGIAVADCDVTVDVQLEIE